MQKAQTINNFATFVTGHPWWILFLTLSAVSVMSAGLTRLGFENDYRVYFSQENPQLQAFNAILDTYNKSDSVLFILQPVENTVFTPQTLQAIHELTEKSWQVPFSSRVDSISNFQHTEAKDDDLIVADLVPSRLSPQQIEKIQQIALNEPLLLNRLLSPQGHVSAVNVTLQLPGKSPDETMQVASAVRALAREIESNYAGMKIHITGMAMLSSAFNESALNDNTSLIPIMYAVVMLVLMLSFRSLSATFAVLLLVIFNRLQFFLRQQSVKLVKSAGLG